MIIIVKNNPTDRRNMARMVNSLCGGRLAVSKLGGATVAEYGFCVFAIRLNWLSVITSTMTQSQQVN